MSLSFRKSQLQHASMRETEFLEMCEETHLGPAGEDRGRIDGA